MVKPQLGHDQEVFEWRWSLNTGGWLYKSRFHCIIKRLYNMQIQSNVYILHVNIPA